MLVTVQGNTNAYPLLLKCKIIQALLRTFLQILIRLNIYLPYASDPTPRYLPK